MMARPMKQVAGVALGLVALLASAGCVRLGAAKPPAHLLRLSTLAPAPVGQAAQAKPADVLVVAEPEAERSLSVLRVAVQVNATDIAYMKGGEWAEKPSRQLQGLLAEALRRKPGRVVLDDAADAPRGAARLEGRLLAFGYDARTKSVVVRLDVLRRASDGTLTQRRFEVIEPKVAGSVVPVAQALNQAANTLVAQVADWVK